MKTAPDEVQVWCKDCNCYLHSVSIYERPNTDGIYLTSCPDSAKCREEDEANYEYFSRRVSRAY